MSETIEHAPRTIPWAAVTLCLSFALGVGLAIAGVYVLHGLGYALLAGAMPCLLLAGVLLRGILS
jgi:hypothetical protein